MSHDEVLEFSVTISKIEDPDVFARLNGLKGRPLARRVRALLRQAINGQPTSPTLPAPPEHGRPAPMVVPLSSDHEFDFDVDELQRNLHSST